MQGKILFSSTAKLSPDERSVWAVLSNHRGKPNAITGDRLSAETEISVRRLRRLMTRMIETHHLPIGSTPGGRNAKAGYFIIQTQEELEEVCARQYWMAISMLVKVGHLRGWGKARISRQIGMDLQMMEVGK